MRQTFTKAERLSSKKLIEELFSSGRSFTCSPYKIVWNMVENPESPAVQAAFSVPKKNFKRAVDRNKLKRRAREAYRKNKEQLYDALSGKKIALMFVYTSKELSVYELIEMKINQALKRLIDEAVK